MTAENFPHSRLRRLAIGEECRALRQQLFSAAAALLIATLVLMGTSLANLRSSLQESQAAEDSMLEITTIETRLVDFDRALAAYGLTGDQKFQVYMTQLNMQLWDAAAKLRHSLQKTPPQLKRYDEIAGMVNKWQSLVNDLRRPDHRGDIGKSQAWIEEKRIIYTARGKLWQILMSERTSRYANNRKMIAEAQSSFWLAVVFIVISLVAGLAFFGMRNAAADVRPRSR